MAGVLQSMRQDGTITGWTNELYAVANAFHTKPAFLVERAAATLLGIKVTDVAP